MSWFLALPEFWRCPIASIITAIGLAGSMAGSGVLEKGFCGAGFRRMRQGLRAQWIAFSGLTFQPENGS